MGGKMLGTTPVTLTIPVQDAAVDLEFFDTGLGLSKPEQLTLKPGDNGTHKVEIAKGKLVLKLQDGVEVTVDGKAVGTAPLAPLSLWEGKHVVQLTRGDQRSAGPWSSPETSPPSSSSTSRRPNDHAPRRGTLAAARRASGAWLRAGPEHRADPGRSAGRRRVNAATPGPR